jgi:hypothetical protein
MAEQFHSTDQLRHVGRYRGLQGDSYNWRNLGSIQNAGSTYNETLAYLPIDTPQIGHPILCMFPLYASCRWGTNCRTPPDRTLQSSDSEDVPCAHTVYRNKITSHHCVESIDRRVNNVRLVTRMRRFKLIVVLWENTCDSAADTDNSRVESSKS